MLTAKELFDVANHETMDSILQRIEDLLLPAAKKGLFMQTITFDCPVEFHYEVQVNLVAIGYTVTNSVSHKTDSLTLSISWFQK